MKIAVISDIHGNTEALSAVLEDIQNYRCDKIYCLGDIAMAGPEPSKTVAKIKELSKSPDFKLIQGNTDQKLGTYNAEFEEILDKNVPVMAEAYRADLKELSDDDKDFLASLPEKLSLTENNVNILLTHGSPRRNDENVTAELSPEQLDEILEGVKEDIIFCGHTHVPCGYATEANKTIINVGSVGRPFSENPKACYALLTLRENGDFEVSHRFVDYDFLTASEKLKKRGFKGCEKLAAMLIKATSRYPE